MATQPHKRIIVGISGASGTPYALRIIRLLLAADVETHLVVSPVGQRLLQEELGIRGLDLVELAGLPPGHDPHDHLILHQHRDVGATIASGSFRHDGMVIIPCSSNTLAAVATGMAGNLLHRAAYVTLKERRRLVLVHREMPITATDMKNMLAINDMGGIIAPANPGFYMNPQTMDDLIDFVVARCLDLLNVPHTLNVRWKAKDYEE